MAELTIAATSFGSRDTIVQKPKNSPLSTRIRTINSEEKIQRDSMAFSMTYTKLSMVASLFFVPCQSSAFEREALIGNWEVADIYCRSCKTVDRSDLGQVIHLTENKVNDPLAGGECPGNVGYREIAANPSLRKNTIQKINPKWVDGKDNRIKWVSITCRDLDFILVMMLPDGSLGYTSEGEISYRLIRKNQ